jgi:hypothetical protein
MLDKAHHELEDTIKDLDFKLHRVVAKQEYEFVKSYQIHIKQKEKELKDMILALSEKYKESGSIKDDNIQVLKHLVKQSRENEVKMDRQVGVLKDKIRKWKDQADAL